jgi:hypothetical protein
VAEDLDNRPADDDIPDEWLSLAEDEEDEVDKGEAKALKAAKTALKATSELKNEMKVEKILDRFEASATEEEKRLLGIYRRGDEDPKQLQGLIDLVQTKTKEAAKDDEDDEAATKKAEEIAREAYGVGPLQTGRPAATPDKSPEELLYDRIAAGDVGALVDGLMAGQQPPWMKQG